MDVPTLDSSVSTTKGGYFHSCVGAVTPENQRQFLYDLCDDPPPATGPLPDADARRGLLSILAAADGVSPLADGLSQVTPRAVRNQWFTAASRLPHSASSAITAARALLESTCQTILVERGEAPDTSGDLGRLYNQTRRALVAGSNVDRDPVKPLVRESALTQITWPSYVCPCRATTVLMTCATPSGASKGRPATNALSPAAAAGARQRSASRRATRASAMRKNVTPRGALHR